MSLGSLFGGSAGKKDMKKSNQLMREAVERLEAVGVPTVEAQKIALQDPEIQGLLEAEQLAESEMAGVSIDPRMKQAQMSALEEISGLAQTGLGAEDKAAFNALRRDASGMAQAQNASALQEANARGTLDSGSSLIASLNAGQNAANRASAEGDRLAANAAAARREALTQKANLATSMGQNDFSNKAQVANAADSINRFNSQNRQNVNERNLDARQGIANAGTANRNQEEMYNKGLVQQKFQNDFAKAGGVAGATQNLAANHAAQGQAAAQGEAAMNGAILNAGMGIATAGMSNAAQAAAPAAKAATPQATGAADLYTGPKRTRIA